MDKQAYYVCKSCGEKFIITYPDQPKPPQNMICPICGCRVFTIEEYNNEDFFSTGGSKF